MAKSKKPKLKKFVVAVKCTVMQYRFFKAKSAKHAENMYYDDQFDHEYDYDEKNLGEDVIFVEKVK